MTAGSSCACATRAPAFPKEPASGCSNASTVATTPFVTGPAWGSPSPRRSRRPTAGRSPRGTPTAAAPSSRSACRLPGSARPKPSGDRRPGPRLEVATRRAWRAWLHAHHRTAKEIWLVYYRKASGRPRIAYNDAVEEALCFGWIDSNQKGIDDERFAQRFTPRRRVGGLSEMNKHRVRRLVAEGRMTPAGMAVIGGAAHLD